MTQQPLGEPITGHTYGVSSVAFSAGGYMLASGSDDKTVRLWNINPNAWIKQLCAIADRNLSHKEWQKYLGNRPHEKTYPDLPTDTLGAIELVNQGQELAKQGKLKEAISQFKQAQKWDAKMVYFDPETQAKAIYAVEQGKN
ncbi:MAG: hypothetical protein HC877_06470 [Thioploca sp.]|nr:hypothetical protein [Thioploca sp.]